ncbi:MAG: ribonuclease HII [Deltaproteobacteria bacterium CG_4_8_14_3_um_filter_43_13]|nr:MAG: ribonuclease HII [Deltaproteobacteria bacterium CG06_land_8_20_14_3_00_44_19]PIX24497.1 MAG: ribonuclease HII [Deltaproteobacteria bacterium CG_4_8_14_3_um_filter_43_13]PIZ18481.1 MAG: ribonuclease HII [Deltaproteobacteria bacterium CG_4_10_14_0_8_um_filter_43_12]
MISPSHVHPERGVYARGYRFVAGVDEAGRGPLAGPVVAAAVILPENHTIQGIADSKKLSAHRREILFSEIYRQAEAVGVGIVDQREIERINILQASLKAMQSAVAALNSQVDYILVDGIHSIPTQIPQSAIKKGDTISPSIAAASIIAKVTRDRIMVEYHSIYPQYNFARNKGYGTEEHMQAIKRSGCCEIHRKTFRGVKEYLSVNRKSEVVNREWGDDD